MAFDPKYPFGWFKARGIFSNKVYCIVCGFETTTKSLDEGETISSLTCPQCTNEYEKEKKRKDEEYGRVALANMIKDTTATCCGVTLKVGQYCPKCGKGPININIHGYNPYNRGICPKCRTPITLSDRFCRNCGTSVI